MLQKKSLHLEIVTAHESIFSEHVISLQVSGEAGELGIFPGHSALLSSIKPGSVKLIDCNGIEQVIYLSGGFLEVQPDTVIILADVAIRGEELDEHAAQQAKRQAEQRINNCSGGFDYAEAAKQLAQAVAQLQVTKWQHHLNKHGSAMKVTSSTSVIDEEEKAKHKG